jgi:hypothetical protein
LGWRLVIAGNCFLARPLVLDAAQVNWSVEFETQYTFVLKGHKLTAHHVRHGDIRLIPAGRDRFTTTEWFLPQVNFQRDSSNRVASVTLGGGRVTGIRLTRKDTLSAAAPKP